MRIRSAWALGATVCGALALAPPVSATQHGPGGVRCTIVGTRHADLLRGSKGDDVICGLGGADRIRTGSGNDVAAGGGGADVIATATGDDNLSGGSGNDTLDAGPDDDVVDGGPGADSLDPGTGLDDCGDRDDQDAYVSTACWFAFRIDGMSITPNTVDSSLAPGTALVTVQVTDLSDSVNVGGPFEVTGTPYLDDVSVGLLLPGPLGFLNDSSLPPQSLSLVSGDATHGTWTGPVTIPQNYPTGEYRLYLNLRELMPGATMPGTGQVYGFNWIGPPELAAADLPRSIQQVGSSDPRVQLDDLEISPHVVERSHAYPGTIKIDVGVAKLHGEADSVRVNVDRDVINLWGDGNWSDWGPPGPMRQGTWTVFGSVRDTAPLGVHTISSIDVIDDGEVRTFDTADLIAMGFDPTFEVTPRPQGESPPKSG
jgi:hypothetical protein